MNTTSIPSFPPPIRYIRPERPLCVHKICQIILHTDLFTMGFVSLNQWTPLHVAAETSNLEKILVYLVGKGADINMKDNNGVNI